MPKGGLDLLHSVNLAWGSCPRWYWVVVKGGVVLHLLSAWSMCVVLAWYTALLSHRVFDNISVVRSVCAGMAVAWPSGWDPAYLPPCWCRLLQSATVELLLQVAEEWVWCGQVHI